MSSVVEHLVSEIEGMGLEALRKTWRERYGVPPLLQSTLIMRQLVSWRVQAEVMGGLDTTTRRALARSGPIEAEGKHLGVGAKLTRNWQGREVTVVVEEEGFRWDDRIFPSLSAAATAIAGSRWNGPRFFGLRDG
ncbi:DUF2924 domain-containing protein [Qipengyuania huizhouensis]|uniref:DUF2924 domain-containing protein n=1 Tax=Qipengyuania huizhouensis TaxID=2867245 RepID=UPI001C86B75D|nr:DUF2924 domain-containing protein [Qipengyuania huizhouensis]MBX7459733.1 DUF2924 domain-containing protein [Qipengyuania huizhouensis]